jgi:hypothetical protein
VKVVWRVERVVEQWIFKRKLCRLMNDQSGWMFFAPAHVKMRDMYLMPCRKVFEDIVVP